MLNIFEQPWTILIAAIFALFVVLIVWMVCPGKRRWWQLALPVLIGAAGVGLDLLVQTDLEKIREVIKTGVKAVEDENCRPINQIISDSYRDSYHSSKSSLMAHCRMTLSEPLVAKNIARIVSIDLSGQNATVILTVRVIFDKRSFVYQSFNRELFAKVKVNLQKQADNRWLISQAEILEINRQQANWRELRKAGG